MGARARDMADRLGHDWFVSKRRPEPNVAEVMNVVEMCGQTVIVDDIIDTGGTLVRAGNF